MAQKRAEEADEKAAKAKKLADDKAQAEDAQAKKAEVQIRANLAQTDDFLNKVASKHVEKIIESNKTNKTSSLISTNSKV